MSKQRPTEVKWLDQTSPTGASSFQGQGARAKNSSTHHGHPGRPCTKSTLCWYSLTFLWHLPLSHFLSKTLHGSCPLPNPPPPPTPPAPPRRHPWQASLPGHAFLLLRGGIPSSMPSIFSSHSTRPLWSFVYCPPSTSPHTELMTCQWKFLQTIQLPPVLCFSVCRWIFHIHFKYQSRTRRSYPEVPIWLNILLWVPHQGTICFRNRTTVSLGFLSDLNNPSL